MYKNLKENYPLYEGANDRVASARCSTRAQSCSATRRPSASRSRAARSSRSATASSATRSTRSAPASTSWGWEKRTSPSSARTATAGRAPTSPCWRRRGVVIPIDKDLSDEETQYILDFSDAEAVICTKNSEAKLDRLLPSLPKLKTVICLGTPAEEGRYAADALAEKGRELLAGGDKRFTEAPIDNYVLKELLFTSGTTGKSKGVMLSADTLLFNIMQSQS